MQMDPHIKKGIKLDKESAIKQFNDESLTCLIYNDDTIYTSKDRGLKPLIYIVENKVDLCGYNAIDKIVGNAAAIIYVKIGIESVHTPVLSKSAFETFKKYNIEVTYDELVDCILNKEKTNPGPFEVLIADAKTLDEAYTLIVNKTRELAKQNNK